MSHSRKLALSALALVCVAAPCIQAAVTVTEADYQTFRRLEYAEALFDARKMFFRSDKAKVAAAEQAFEKAWTDSGWTRDRHGEIYDAIIEVHSNLRAEKDGDLSAEDVKSALAECDRTTVATVRAHYDELDNSNDSQRAEQQVRDEIKAEREGEAPTEAQLLGTWVFDIDATLESMGLTQLLGDELEKIKAEMIAKVGSPSYSFGPGQTMESRVKGPDGEERVDKGVYRLDGRTIYMKAENSRREHDLKVGLRNGRLLLGSNFGMMAFSRR